MTRLKIFSVTKLWLLITQDSKACKLKAKLFYVTVIGVGCQSYLDTQREACVCVNDDARADAFDGVKPSRDEL